MKDLTQIGILIGAAVGDAMGAHFEGKKYDPSATLANGWSDIKTCAIQLGIWTDDTALSLCIADSLLVNGAYDPLDIRHR